MCRLEEQIMALPEADFKRLYDILQSAAQKMKGGYSTPVKSILWNMNFRFPLWI